ncbi:MAG: response regulator [Actinobacteria bacterium]|nr:response regulator [Actinomycetota bacterium]
MAYNILIVDDSSTMRRIISRVIQMAEVPVQNVIQAENGAEAWEIMQHEWLDIVFLDLNMPVMDGTTLVEKMRADKVLRTLPVVVVSAERSKERSGLLEEMGVDAYIRKPFTPEVMRGIFETVLGG